MNAEFIARQRQTWAVVDLLRPFNVLGSALSFGIGFALGGAGGVAAALVGVAILALAHSVATLENDIQDLAIDRANGRGGALQDHTLPIKRARLLVIVLSAITLVVAVRSSDPLLNFGFAAAFLGLSWAYNNRPLQLSRRPLGSMAVMGLCYGALPVLYGYAASGGTQTWMAAALGIIWFAQRVSISILKDFKDVAGDTRYHKLTFYLRFGRRAVVNISLGLGIAAFGALLAILPRLGVLQNPWSLVFAVPAVALAVRETLIKRGLLTAQYDTALNHIFHRTFAAHNQFEGVLLLCFICLAR